MNTFLKNGGVKDDIEISFSEFTSTNGILTKTIKPNGIGGVEKTPSANMISGYVYRMEMPFSEFGPYIRRLKKNQAIAHGVCEEEQARIVTKSDRANGRGWEFDTVTRSKDDLSYLAGPGLAMFDHDPKNKKQALAPEKFRATISKVWPEFQNYPTWTTPSTSSCIRDLNGNELTGEGAGFHMYFPVPDASELPTFAKILFKRLWCAGYGHIEISKSGSLLPRTIFDASVFSPERLDFVAGAECIDCIQKLPEPVYREGGEIC